MEVAAKGCIFQWDFSETSGKTAPVPDLQPEPHTPWSQSHQQQAQLDGLSNTRPAAWLHPRRRITALQMGVTQVWQHKSVTHMSDVNCITECHWQSAPWQVLLPATHHRLNGWYSFCEAPSMNLSPVAYVVSDIVSLLSGHWIFSWLAYWFALFHNLLVSPDLSTQGLGFYQRAMYSFISWNYLKCSLSMVVCLCFLYDLFPTEAWTAAVCCCFRKEFEDYQSCLIVGLLQVLFSSPSGAAHLAPMFLCLVTGCNTQWSRLCLLLPTSCTVATCAIERMNF